jgi:type I restriction enzyme S subunit
MREKHVKINWHQCLIDDVSDRIHYGYTAKADPKGTGAKYLRITDIQNGKVFWNDVPSCDISDDELNKFKLRENDLVFARTGGTVGKSYLLDKTIPEKAVFASYLIRVIINRDILPKYIYTFFQSLNYWGQIELNKTGLKTNVNAQILSKISFPLAPLPEQRAIVAKIEQLFSELDNGVANLKAAKDKLDIYRQAVLKKAFEGELTKEWRKQQTDLPTADELLEIISEKRKAWIEAEIAKGHTEAQRIGNKLKKLKTTAQISEKIPTGWCWASFLQSCHLVIDCHNKTAPYEDNGIHLVRTTNVRNGRLNLKEKIKYVSHETFEYWSKRCVPEPGDILFTREAPMGEAAIIPKDTQICMGQRMMLLRVFSNCLNNKYLLYNILSATFQQRSIKNAIGTGVKHLRVGDVEQLVFPLCSYEEQVQIVQEIETRLSVCDNAIANIEESLTKAEALRQSILKKAFAGKLLTNTELQACRQESDWEPAGKLLERIKHNKKSTPRKKSIK